MPQIAIKAFEGDRGTRLRVTGELRGPMVTRLERAVEEHARQDDGPIVLDLRGVPLLDSSGIKALIMAGRSCRRHHSDLYLVSGPPNLQRLLTVAGVVDDFEIGEPSRHPSAV
jgi:anti-sigma B factor antagonist